MELITVVPLLLLSLIVLSLLIERYLFGKRMAEELREYRKALIARNVNEFIAVSTAEKQATQPPPVPDEVLLSDLPDTEFDSLIKKQVS